MGAEEDEEREGKGGGGEGGGEGGGPNQADCEDVLSETGPKPGQTRAQTRQIRRMSQAGRAAQPGQTRPNQAKPGPKPGKL